jgi:hypothetical protein
MAKSSEIEPINIELYEKAWARKPSGGAVAKGPRRRKKKQLTRKKKKRSSTSY